MKLYTSYFAKVRQLREMGFDNLVCVAGYAPNFFHDLPDAHFMPELAPRRFWWQEWYKKFRNHTDSEESKAWYEQKYYDTVLSKLDPQTVLNELGDKAVMLCYEPPEMFCHRHLIADWLTKHTGVEVEEIRL
jgi:hypothetical protein